MKNRVINKREIASKIFNALAIQINQFNCQYLKLKHMKMKLKSIRMRLKYMKNKKNNNKTYLKYSLNI